MENKKISSIKIQLSGLFSFLTAIILLTACSNNLEEDVRSICLNKQIIITELEVQNSWDLSFYRGLTFKAIKASLTNIKVVAVLDSHQFIVIGEVNDFVLSEGTQDLNERPRDKIIQEGLIYTTYHYGNGLTSYPILPEGKLHIYSFDKECNTISIRAYAYSNELTRDIRESIAFSFQNLPLNNQLYQL